MKRSYYIFLILFTIIITLLFINPSISAAADNENNNEQTATISELSAIANANVGDIVYYGKYEQDGNTANGPEPIAWYVLEKQDGRALLLSTDVLDQMPFDKSTSSIVSWENSSIRSFLNNQFLATAFNSTELSRIPLVPISNKPSSTYCPYGWASYAYSYNTTNDRAFLLSLDEVYKYLGVSQIGGSYWGVASPYLQAKPSEAVITKRYNNSFDHFSIDANGNMQVYNSRTRSQFKDYIYKFTEDDYRRNFAGTNYPVSCINKYGDNWWLRSSGVRLWTPGEIDNGYTNYAYLVNSEGYVGGQPGDSCAGARCGDMIASMPMGVRPAIYVNF